MHQLRSTFSKFRCRESARRCGAKHMSKSKCTKHHMLGPFLKVQMWFCVAGASKGFCTLPKVSKTWGFCSSSNNDGMRGTFEEDLERCISRGRRSTRDMFIRDVRRSGRWFLERGCILEHQIFRFAKMILRDKCSTSYDLASLLHGRRSTLHRWSGQIAKRIVTRPSAPHSTFHFWRKSRRIVFDVVSFENWGKSRRIASFSMLPTSKIKEVSQTCCVFDVVTFENGGILAELLRFQACR